MEWLIGIAAFALGCWVGNKVTLDLVVAIIAAVLTFVFGRRK